MIFGAYTIFSIETGSFKLDGGSIFGAIPKVIWQKSVQVDDSNRIKLAARCLLIKGHGRIILVDTGNGAKKSDKFKILYDLNNDETELMRSLNSYNIKPADVTDVILTHLHFDHSGGATIHDEKADIPAFPNARYYVQKKQWQQALDPTQKDRASFIPADYLPLMENNVLELLDGECEPFPGLNILLSDGHTPSLQMVKIQQNGNTLFYPGDLIPVSSHLQLPYIAAFDILPLVTLNDKIKYLTQAFEENWFILFSHDPLITAGTVKKTEKGFILDQLIRFE